MAEARDGAKMFRMPDLEVPEPGPGYERDPIPGTMRHVVARIVDFVQTAVREVGGPAYEFNRNGAEAVFEDKWGRFIEAHLRHHHPSNPWPDEWKNVVHTAKKHAQFAVELAKEQNHKPVSLEDFKEAGYKAAGFCEGTFGRLALGCWCTTCPPPAVAQTSDEYSS